MFISRKAEVAKITIDSFEPTFIFILGLELLSGIGVDSKSKLVEGFKKIINESPEFKVFFIIASGTMEDCGALRSAITHVILDASTIQHQSQLKISDHFPDTVDPPLGVYYLATSETNKCRKFKKMIFDKEII